MARNDFWGRIPFWHFLFSYNCKFAWVSSPVVSHPFTPGKARDFCQRTSLHHRRGRAAALRLQASCGGALARAELRHQQVRILASHCTSKTPAPCNHLLSYEACLTILLLVRRPPLLGSEARCQLGPTLSPPAQAVPPVLHRSSQEHPARSRSSLPAPMLRAVLVAAALGLAASRLLSFEVQDVPQGLSSQGSTLYLVNSDDAAGSQMVGYVQRYQGEGANAAEAMSNAMDSLFGSTSSFSNRNMQSWCVMLVTWCHAHRLCL